MLGDWDACVPYTDALLWVENIFAADLSLPISTPWHAWKYTSSSGATNQVAGYALSYDISSIKTSNSQILGANSASFTFASIKGGRHEVPTTAGYQALEMLNRLINDIDF